MIRILAVLLLAFPAFGTSVQVGTDAGFSNGATVTSGNFLAASDVSPFNLIRGVDDDTGPNASFTFCLYLFSTIRSYCGNDSFELIRSGFRDYGKSDRLV